MCLRIRTCCFRMGNSLLTEPELSTEMPIALPPVHSACAAAPLALARASAAAVTTRGPRRAERRVRKASISGLLVLVLIAEHLQEPSRPVHLQSARGLARGWGRGDGMSQLIH